MDRAANPKEQTMTSYQEPRFEIGDPVGYPDGDAPGTMGRIRDRYINDDGVWEYEIRYQDGSGSRISVEADLHTPVPFR
jgi:hypothetical protein